MIGKTLATRVILLIIAILLIILLWNYGVSSEIKVGLIILVVIRVIFVLTKLAENKNVSND